MVLSEYYIYLDNGDIEKIHYNEALYGIGT